jgi:hypothetical protein
VDVYHAWCDLKPGVSDIAFCEGVAKYMGHLKSEGLIENWRLMRRKLGLGLPTLGEFHLMIEVKNLHQLDQAFEHAAARRSRASISGSIRWCRTRPSRSTATFPMPSAIAAKKNSETRPDGLEAIRIRSSLRRRGRESRRTSFRACGTGLPLARRLHGNERIENPCRPSVTSA